jgi:lipopolysaccharide export system protein LptA
MKIFIILILLFSLLEAEKVEISADSFEANEPKQISIFSGNVKIKKCRDEFNASRVVILFDKKNKPTKYSASGEVKFQLKTKEQIFVGHADKLIYEPITQKYQILGNAFIHEKSQNRKLYGEKIIIDRKKGTSKITGTKSRPVKFIFSVKE